jgi:hypothetical protein
MPAIATAVRRARRRVDDKFPSPSCRKRHKRRSELDGFCDGLTDDILTSLSRVSAIG